MFEALVKVDPMWHAPIPQPRIRSQRQADARASTGPRGLTRAVELHGDRFDEAPFYQYSRALCDRHDEGTRTTVAQDAERVLTLAGIVVRSAASVSRADAAGAGHMLPLILIFLGLSLAMGLVGFAGLASTMSTNCSSAPASLA